MFSDRTEVSVNYLNQPLFLKSHQTFLLIKMLTMDLPTPLKPFDSKKWLVLEVSPHGSIVKQRGDEKEKNINIIPRIILFPPFLFYMEEKLALFVKFSDSDIKKLISIAAPEMKRKSTKVTFNGQCKN